MRSRPPMLVALVAAGALVASLGLFVPPNGGDAPPSHSVAADPDQVTPNPVGMADWMYSQRVFPEDTVDPDAVADARAQSAQMSADTLARTDGAAATRWTLNGPANIGGRIRELAPDPAHQGTVYIAAAAGGIWKSTNSGQTFAPAWPDDSVQAMGAVAVDVNGVVWAGTGEPDSGRVSADGDGIYRSADGGVTWQRMGLVNSGSLGTIAIDPTDPDRVFASAQGRARDTNGQRGLYLTEDGGATWTAVLQPPDENGLDSIGAIDVAISPNDPNIVLATTWDKIRTVDGPIFGKGSKLYRSTDGGHTWTDEQQAPLPISKDIEGQPVGATYVGRMGIAFAPSETGRVYLISSTAEGNFNGFFTSTNNGKDWTAVGATSGGVLQQISGGYAWWFGRVWVDPQDEDHVFVAGVALAESMNGGTSWATNSAVHADQHGMAWDPFVADRVYLGNDGGFYKNDSNGGSSTQWTKTAKLAITQIYEMDSSEQDVERLNAGAQDNNSLKSWQSDGTTDGTWVAYVGGDGMMNRIDPENQNFYYGCYQYGGCSAFTPVGNPAIAVPGARKNWVTPLEFRGTDTKTLYTGSEYVSRLTAKAGGFTWTKISGDLTGGPTPRGGTLYGTISAIGTGYTHAGLAYAGTDDGRLWRSKTADAASPADVTWKRIKDKALPKRWVTRVKVSPEIDKWTVATFSGWRYLDGSRSPHVVVTKDNGKHWTDISGNLPDAPVNDVIWHPTDKESLFVATDVGVFSTTDLGATWIKVGANLPLVSVQSINLQTETMTLFAATYGRSIWQTSVAAETPS